MAHAADDPEELGTPSGWLPNQDWDASARNGIIRPGIVHRLDKGTTGLLVVAKDAQTLTGLAAQFKAHTVSSSCAALGGITPSPSQISLSRRPLNHRVHVANTTPAQSVQRPGPGPTVLSGLKMMLFITYSSNLCPA